MNLKYKEGYYEIKKSKFYTYIFNEVSKEDVDSVIDNVKKKHKKAKHLLYAYEYQYDNNIYSKFSNDNEPCNVMNSVISMLKRDGNNSYLIIIVRYFGGTLLGSGVLLRSYLTSFKDARDSTVYMVLED